MQIEKSLIIPQNTFARVLFLEALALLKIGTKSNKGTGKWIAEYASAYCDWRAPRIRFVMNGEQSKGTPDFDCVLIYFGPNWQRFAEVFKPYGIVSSILNGKEVGNHEMMVGMLPARSLDTDGGTEPNNNGVPAVDDHTIGGTDDAAEISEDALAVVDTSELDSEVLTYDEIRDLHRLERKVERVFYEGGMALREIRDRRLYRGTHKSFEQYCKDRFGFQRSHSYQLIDAASVVDNLSAIGGHGMVQKQAI